MSSVLTKHPAIQATIHLLGAFLICTALFLVTTILTYCIPTNLMETHLRESAIQLASEGVYHSAIEGGVTQQLDNWTVAKMLNEAAHGSSNPIRGALLNPKANVGDNKISQLADGIGVPDEELLSNYPQYWHGYLLFLKPLLLILNLSEIRELLFVMFLVLLGLVALLLSKREGIAAGLVVVASFAVFNVFVMINSLSLSACPYITLFAMLFVLWSTKNESRFLINDVLWWTVPFFVCGGLTSFFDFLCTPIMTLGMPLALLVFISRDAIDRKNAVRCAIWVFGICLCWFAGYVLIWASKWILAWLITGEDVIARGLGKVAERSAERASEAVDSLTISRIDSIIKNVGLAFPKWSIKLCIIGTIAAFALIAAMHIKQKTRPAIPSLWWVVPLFLTAMLPYMWYLFAANHSYQHSMFTYRSQIVFVFAALLFLTGLCGAKAKAALGKHLRS